MAENTDLILKEPPRKLEYIDKLRNYDKPTTLLEKAKTKFTRNTETRPHTISQWAEILGSTKNNQNTRDFLQKLIENNALKEDGVKGDPPNQVKKYRLDKSKLLQAFYDSNYYQWNRDIFFEVVNKKESNRKIVTDL